MTLQPKYSGLSSLDKERYISYHIKGVRLPSCLVANSPRSHIDLFSIFYCVNDSMGGRLAFRIVEGSEEAWAEKLARQH